ncbi:MAG: penicillin-binding protein [Clostridiales bacterium]|nr:penicillin-binding protein [Clostridiales bacterium]
MKKIMYRSYFAFLIAIAVVLGVGVYLVRLWTQGDEWVMLRANQSVFSEGILNTGVLTDRNGIVLAKAGDGVYSYAEDETVRKSCFHVVGDYTGNIGTGALSLFDDRLAGYDRISGTAGISGKGSTVRLSVDSGLNATAYEALAGRRGAVLVSDYKTGEILCMVSTPSYDPNTTPDLNDANYEGVFINRTIGATYTPGSVFKLVTLAAAIDYLPDLQNMTFYCGGSENVGGDIVACTGTHGTQNIEEALAHSCNCAFSQLAQKLGADKISEYAEEFGLTESLDLCGAETRAGSFERAENGSSDLSWSGIGQYTDLVSPYAMLRLVSSIANGGVVEEPTLLKGGRTEKTRLLKETTADRIASMMNYNVVYGYGENLFPGLKICAKTGTAEVGNNTDHAWIVGFLDDSEHPLAFSVIIENGGGGLVNAGALANTVLQAAVAK